MRKRFLFLMVLVGSIQLLKAHPGGNLVTLGDDVFWSYVNPVGSSQHKACVMHWVGGKEVNIWLQSEYVGSDFYLTSLGEKLYIIEAYNNQRNGKVFFRLLKSIEGNSPIEIWPWQEDKMRTGGNGFSVISDEEIWFCHYPAIYSFKKGEAPFKIYEGEFPISRIRKVSDGSLLLLGESSCIRVDHSFGVLDEWQNLNYLEISNPPFGGDRVFDVDYEGGELLVAYWGGRQFYLINSKKEKSVLHTSSKSFVPHWVAFGRRGILMFASILDPPTPILPKLMIRSEGETTPIWE